ncbi:MAG TPA: cation:proton antiporter, partial [Gemmatimonadales bacterium]|nr:cation:proton antiporter [Gemmatimonadales bacterium]
MHDTLLRDLVVLVAVSVPVVLAAHRLRIPSVVGFLLAGVAIGPSGLGLIGDPEAVRRLAEIGVVLLLFSVGLELSLTRVMGLGRLVIVGGAIQVIGTMALVTAVFLVLGREGRPALFLGALLALSSTAIALKVYTQRDELETPHGRAVVAISVFQDLAVVPLMLLIPLLGAADASFAAGTRQVALSLAGAAALVVAGRMLVPRALEHVVRTRNRELFTLAIVVIGLGAAWLASLFGLSLALGAFLVGLVVSESEYGAQALSDILPFRDVFSGIFFASVGMLLDLSTVAAAPLATLGFVGIVIVLKAAVAAGAVLAAGRPLQVAVASALGLAQVGEFSFVLAAAGLPLALVSARDYQLFLAASVLSMLVAPFLIAQAGSFAEAVGRWFGYVPLAVHAEQRPHLESLSDHVIVVGYGLNGRNLARALRGAGIPYVILEQNMHAVRRARGEGEPILFGDGTHGEVLERIGIRRARV